jgi:hypothetical protein
VEVSPTVVVHELVEAFSAQLVAAIAGVTNTRDVRTWEDGDTPAQLDSLRAALEATRTYHYDLHVRHGARLLHTVTLPRFRIKS